LDIILNALKNLKRSKDVTLISVGQKGNLKEIAGKFNLLEYGWINDDQLMATLFQASNMFLMPSRQETFGLMAVEAMCCGKLVLTINGENTSVPEVINAPECGIAVDEADFAGELERLVDSTYEVLDRGNKSADYARVTYSKERYVEQIIGVYDEIVQAHKYDEDTKLLLEQLRKYANDNFSVSKSNSALEPVERVIKRNQWIKNTIRKIVGVSWKIAKTIKLDGAIKSTKWYSKLKQNGTVDKLRG